MVRRSVLQVSTLLALSLALSAGCRVHSDLDRARDYEHQGLLVEARAHLQSEFRARASRNIAARLLSIEEQLAEQHFQSAQLALARGLVSDASRELSRCLELDPQSVGALELFRRLQSASLEQESCRRALVAMRARDAPSRAEALLLARRLRASWETPIPAASSDLRRLLDWLWEEADRAVCAAQDFRNAAAELTAAEQLASEWCDFQDAAAVQWHERLEELRSVVALKREHELARALGFECVRRGDHESAFRAFARALALAPEARELRSHVFAARESWVAGLRRARQRATMREEWSRAAGFEAELRRLGAPIEATGSADTLSVIRSQFVEQLLREAGRYELLALPGNALLSLCEAARLIDDAVVSRAQTERLAALLLGAPLVAIEADEPRLLDDKETVSFRSAPEAAAEITVRCQSPRYRESRHSHDDNRAGITRRAGTHEVPNPRFVESTARVTRAREQLAAFRRALDAAAPDQMEHLFRRFEMVRDEVARLEAQILLAEPVEKRGCWVRAQERVEVDELVAVLEWPVELAIADRPTEARTLRAQLLLRRERLTDDAELTKLLSVDLPAAPSVEAQLADECRRQLTELLRELEATAARELLRRAKCANELGEVAQAIELLVRLVLNPKVARLAICGEAEQLLAALSDQGVSIIDLLRAAASRSARAESRCAQ